MTPAVPSHRRYAVAVCASSVALLVRVWLGPAIMPSPFLTAYAAVVFSAWFGGAGPGLLAVILCATTSTYLLVSPHEAPALDGWITVLRVGLFTVTALVISWITAALQRAHGELEGRVAERTAELARVIADLQQHMAERQGTEEALRESQERFANAFHYAPIGMVLAKLSGRPFQVNRAFCEMLGYDEAELLTKSMYDITHPDDIEMGIASLRRLLASETSSASFEKRYFHKLGHLVWASLSVSLVRDSNAAPVYIISQIQDITERKLTEEHLRASEERFALAVAGANDGVWDWSVGSDAVYLSRRLKSILGFEADELEVNAAEWARLVHPDDIGRIAAEIRAHLDGRKTHYESEHRVRHKDGTYRWVLSRGLCVRDESGKPCRIAGSLTDITERKIAEQKLRESEERYRDLVENINDVIFTVDEAGVVTFVSPAIEQVSGHRPSEVVGRSFTEFIVPDDLPPLLSSFEKTKAGQLEPLDYRLVAKNGAVRWVRSSSRPILQGGRLIGLRGVIADITERKRGEEALSESEQRFRATFEQAAVGIAHVAPDGRWLRMNQKLCDIVGYTRDELVGRTFQDVTHPDDLNADLDYVRRMLANEIPTYSMEKRYVRKDGSIVWINLTVALVREPSGEPKYFISVVQDITKRKRAEALLRENEARFRSLANTIAAAIFISQGTRIKYVNPAAAIITGYTEAELLQMEFWDIIHPEFQDLVRERGLARQRGEPIPARYEVKIMTKAGATRWVDFTGSVIEFDGAPAAIGTAFDITERKWAEDEARKHQAELAHALRVRTLGEMASGLAHELNQPLQAIVNYASGGVRRLRSGASPSAQLLEPLEQIRSEALRAGNVINRLRQMVRKGAPRREWVDLNELVVDASRLMEAEVHKHGMTLRLNLAPELPRLQVDGVQIEQVILNLLRNGMEAMHAPANGDRTLSVHTEVVGSDGVEVAVCDVGEGLAPAIADRVFEPFFTTKRNGLGMGLSISRSIIEAHGGRLWATRNPQGGTTFRFAISLSAAGGLDDS